MEPFGSQQAPAMTSLNLRASKRFSLGGGREFGIDADLFNVLNSATASDVTWRSGPTFGYIEEVLPARIGRFGAFFTF
jgi:hypothetical protein